jgi:energy-coupling factor transporter ATP-binding protein EcfA2
MSNAIETPSSGGAALDGYIYQLEVSVWAALDLLLAKQVARQLVLEPASDEDLETDVADEPGALAQDVELDSYRLVIQCKLRNTGPWKHGDLSRILAHGTHRKSARDRLQEDPRVRYLLVTNADVDGVAHPLKVGGLLQWPPHNAMPNEMSANLTDDAKGRIAILASLDAEKIDARTEKLLAERFKMPRSNIGSCRKDLNLEALSRMRGAGAGVWSREEIEAIIKRHGGAATDPALSDEFVRPTNWDELVSKLDTQHAVIITGPSGAGKTRSAKALLANLRHASAGIKVVRIDGGPEKIEGYMHERPIAFEIEDPWGRFRLEPDSVPWNDAINQLLRTAGPDRKFVITSRSDVLSESGPKSLRKKWLVELNEENYGKRERILLFERGLQALPRSLHAIVLRSRPNALSQLSTPLEIQRYFDLLADGMEENESEREYLSRCLSEALQESIEQAILNNVQKRGDWQWAAVTWGLFKARARQSFNVLPAIQAGLTSRDVKFEDGLEPYINFLIAGRNLRQTEPSLSYQHPRVELGLEIALNGRPELSSRTLRYLVETLLALDTGTLNDWGHEGAAHLVAACISQEKLDLNLTSQTQAQLDQWVGKRVSLPGPEFQDDLTLAAAVGSQNCLPAELARWLKHRPNKADNWFIHDWAPPPVSDQWYSTVSADPATQPICEAFIRRLLPSQHWHYPADFTKHVNRLAHGLAPAFRDAALSMVRQGATTNDDAVVMGALDDLPGFAPVVSAAVAYLAECSQPDNDDSWLAIANGEYDEDAEEHYAENLGEEGFTASVFLETYTKALRRRNGWIALRDHELLTDLAYYWLKAIDGQSHVDDQECEALVKATMNTTAECKFWSYSTDNWRPVFSPYLLKRICDGHSDEIIRTAAARAFAHNMRSLRQEIVKTILLRHDNRRLFELVLDLIPSGEDEEILLFDVQQELITSFPKNIADAALALLDKPPLRDVNIAHLEYLRSLDAGQNQRLKLAQARALASYGVEVRDVISDALNASYENSNTAIDLALNALELAIQHEHWHLVEAALHHRFADVRERALIVLASRISGPFPEKLLSFAKDKGHRVRSALLQIIKSRNHPSHIHALLELTKDTWSKHGEYYYDDGDVDYPIAVESARCIRDQYKVDDQYVDTIIEIAKLSADTDVGRALLSAVIRKQSDAQTGKVIELALGNIAPLHRVAAGALMHDAKYLSLTAADRLTAKNLVEKIPHVAVPLTFVVGASSSPQLVISVAQTLAVSTSRKALLVPLLIGTLERENLSAKVADLLPLKLTDALGKALDNNVKMSRDILNELGDVRIVERILSQFHFLFEPRSKTNLVPID